MRVVREAMYDKFLIKYIAHHSFALYSPFFLSLTSGNLDSSSFLLSISQDLHFLPAFSRALQLAEDNAGLHEDKTSIRKLIKRVEAKLKTYHLLVREWGFELPAESAPMDATTRYTEFLLATASGKFDGENMLSKIATPFERMKLSAYTLGAIAPCMCLTALTCKKVLRSMDPDDTNHIYKNWVHHHVSKNFEEAAHLTDNLLDQLGVSLTGEELDVVQKLYLKALKLAVEFFCTLPVVQQTVVPLSRMQRPSKLHITLFCDFDMTCTAIDSSAFLADIAILTASKINASETETRPTRMSSADLRSSWAAISAKYIEKHDRCMERILSTETDGKFSYENLSKALEELARFETKENSVVVWRRVLKGLSRADIVQAGQQLVFQDGCKEVFWKLAANQNLKTDIQILSYCWCRNLIRAAFSPAAFYPLRVHSNELVYEGDISTGEMVQTVESPAQKVQIFSNAVEDHNTDEQHLSIYIGGSVGDLLCLLKADIGIVFGSSPSLKKVGHHFGIVFVPLFSGVVKWQKEVTTENVCPKWKGKPGTLYTVDCWAELQAFFLGL
ncbi:hem oxygenase-like multi-helical [Euphorbia peplus]|nr:hem oxygenase-like multi-helical [Euphorbia peplus]